MRLKLKNGKTLTARAWISAAMPAFAPDFEPVRTVADDLEQLILGPQIEDDKIALEAAAEIVRRGLESIGLMNTLAIKATISTAGSISRTRW